MEYTYILHMACIIYMYADVSHAYSHRMPSLYRSFSAKEL